MPTQPTPPIRGRDPKTTDSRQNGGHLYCPVGSYTGCSYISHRYFNKMNDTSTVIRGQKLSRHLTRIHGDRAEVSAIVEGGQSKILQRRAFAHLQNYGILHYNRVQCNEERPQMVSIKKSERKSVLFTTGSAKDHITGNTSIVTAVPAMQKPSQPRII